jgi:hypothetical protein
VTLHTGRMQVTSEGRRPTDGSLDEAYERLHHYGPEFAGYLSNHGPMVAEVLDRYEFGSATQVWLDGYVRRLEDAPPIHAHVAIGEWQQRLGELSQLPDWLGIFAGQLQEQPWRDVLATWWPRLLPGSVAAATHPLIRAGHAVRALEREETAPRLDELGQALAYWAAVWQPLPGATSPHGDLAAGTALERLPHLPDSGEPMGSRVAGLVAVPGWQEALQAAHAPEQTSEVPAAIDSLVDAAVASYRWNVRGQPTMLVHAATAPAAVGAVLPSLPEDLWPASYDTAWCLTAAVTALFAPLAADRSPVDAVRTPEEAVTRAVGNGDAHVIKFTDVAAQAHERGCEPALEAARLAESLID